MLPTHMHSGRDTLRQDQRSSILNELAMVTFR